jgi:hypothetical protein
MESHNRILSYANACTKAQFWDLQWRGESTHFPCLAQPEIWNTTHAADLKQNIKHFTQQGKQ